MRVIFLQRIKGSLNAKRNIDFDLRMVKFLRSFSVCWKLFFIYKKIFIVRVIVKDMIL